MSFLQSQKHPDLVESQIRPRGDLLHSPHAPQDKPEGANLAVVELFKHNYGNIL